MASGFRVIIVLPFLNCCVLTACPVKLPRVPAEKLWLGSSRRIFKRGCGAAGLLVVSDFHLQAMSY